MASFNLNNQDQIIDDNARAWDDLDFISVLGTSAQTLANFTSTATGTETFTGTVAVTLANFTSTASGTETITGTVAVTLQDFTSTATGTVTVADTTTTLTPGGGNKGHKGGDTGFLRRHTALLTDETLAEMESTRRRQEAEILVLT